MKNNKPLPAGKCRCGICDVILDNSERAEHFKSKEHLEKMLDPEAMQKAYEQHIDDMEGSMKGEKK